MEIDRIPNISVKTMNYGINARIWHVKLGTAIYIEAANQDVVIDMGRSADFPSPLEHINRRYGVNKIDYLIQSHLHHDHIEDVQSMEVFNGRPRLINVNLDGEDTLRERLNQADPDNDERLIEDGDYYFNLREHYVPSTDEDPSDPSWADRATFTNMSLDTDEVSGPLYDRLNNLSTVTAIERDGFKMILTGDMMEDGLKTFMEKDSFVDLVSHAHLLVAPHHGRESGYYDEFVEAVNPEAVIFSDRGKDGVDYSDRDRYANHTTGIDVENEKTGKKDENRDVLTTRKDGRISVKANTATSWKVTKRPISKADAIADAVSRKFRS